MISFAEKIEAFLAMLVSMYSERAPSEVGDYWVRLEKIFSLIWVGSVAPSENYSYVVLSIFSLVEMLL